MAFISGNFRSSRAVAAQARVRQYYGANGPDYYPLLDWREVEGSGEQELQIPIDRERVASGGRTYVEWRFARRGGGKFDEQSLVSLEALAVDRTRWGWYTRTVLSCEQEDTYRFGHEGCAPKTKTGFKKPKPVVSGNQSCSPEPVPLPAPQKILRTFLSKTLLHLLPHEHFYHSN